MTMRRFASILLGTYLATGTALADRPITSIATLAFPPEREATLADYLRSHPVAQSVVVGAETVKSEDSPTGLAAFGYRTIDLGSVVAVAPSRMVRFQDDLRQAPDLYEGLPRNAKVLYLASTFTPGQWAKAGGSGVGLSDLNAQQKPVFTSLLPKQFKWSKYEVNEAGAPSKFLGDGVLSPNEVTGLRLKISRQLDMLVALADHERAYSMRMIPESAEPGSVQFVRDQGEDGDYEGNFGVDFRKEEPNVLRRGDLHTENLRQVVNLPTPTTVGAALEAIGKATNLRLGADIRVRGCSVVAPASVPAGDLLNAIAVSLSGTYRHVGNRYLLVGDRVGSGSRQLLYAAYKRIGSKLVDARANEWRKVILGNGGLAAITWNPNDANRPNEAVQKRLDRDLHESTEFFPSSELSPELKGFLDREAVKSAAVQPLRTDTVNFQTNLGYRFVLPSGVSTQFEGHIGADFQFKPSMVRPRQADVQDPPLPRLKLGKGPSRSLAVHADTAAAAVEAAELAKKYGFAELWLDTNSTAALLSAQKTGLPVRYLCRPFQLDSGEPVSDRTILEDTGSGVVARLIRDAGWEETARMIRMQSYPRADAHLITTDLLSPLDPRWPSRARHISALSTVKGLAGTVLADTQPHGYEPTNPGTTIGTYEPEVRDMWAFGYSDAARVAFFDRYGVDPIDIPEPNLHVDLNLATQFFPDWITPESQMETLFEPWVKFRAAANEAALTALRPNLKGEVLCDVRRKMHAQPPRNVMVLRKWTTRTGLPSYGDQFVSHQAGDITMIFSDPANPAFEDIVNMIRAMPPSAEGLASIDLTGVPEDKIDSVLARAIEISSD